MDGSPARSPIAKRPGIVVVGAGAAGVSASEELMRLGYRGQIRLISGEDTAPYDRTALSKSFLADVATVQPPPLVSTGRLAEACIRVDLRSGVSMIDRERHLVRTTSGQEIGYEKLLLAPGAVPRRLTIPGSELPGVHYLRELEDARKLKAVLGPGVPVVVIGGGVIGLEVASSAVMLGAVVTVIEAAPHVMTRVVPHELASIIERLHLARGVVIRSGASALGFDVRGGAVQSVSVAGGDRVAATVVVVGVGASPRTNLASDAGLTTGDGIVVDEHFRTCDPRIFAAGDAASVWNERLQTHVRTEQWRSAQEQGRLAAASMLGSCAAYQSTPWMWSDQHDFHIQATGYGFEGTDVTLRGDLEERGGLICFGTRDGVLVAAAGVSMGTGIARTIRAAETLIAQEAVIDRDMLSDPGFDMRRLARTTG